jgi:hypothetical protein
VASGNGTSCRHFDREMYVIIRDCSTFMDSTKDNKEGLRAACSVQLTVSENNHVTSNNDTIKNLF